MKTPRPRGRYVLVDDRGWYLAEESEFGPDRVCIVLVPDIRRAARFWKGGEAQGFADKWWYVIGALNVERMSVSTPLTEGGRG